MASEAIPRVVSAFSSVTPSYPASLGRLLDKRGNFAGLLLPTSASFEVVSSLGPEKPEVRMARG